VLVEWKHSHINEQDNIENFKKKALPVCESLRWEVWQYQMLPSDSETHFGWDLTMYTEQTYVLLEWVYMSTI
jgi:hypothetical protein